MAAPVVDEARFAAIVERNNQINLHAKRKELRQAMAIFEQCVHERVANSHTYSAALNANIRCGDIAGAESVMTTMQKAGRKRDVITCTTLMKGYCSDNQLKTAVELLTSMTTKKPIVQPNIRTINTLLRGCVQEGSIVAAEMIMNKSKDYKVLPDVNSWEYLVQLLANGLKVDKILPILGRLKGDPSMSIGLVGMHMHTLRSAVMLSEWKTCRKVLEFIKNAPAEDMVGQHSAQCEETTVASGKTLGGKRAWGGKDNGGGVNANMEASRLESLVLYKEHNKAERIAEIALIERFIDKMKKVEKKKCLEEVISHFLKIFSFVPSDVEGSTPETTCTAGDIFAGTTSKFGVEEIAKRMDMNGCALKDLLAGGREALASTANSPELTVIQAIEAYYKKAFNSSGMINFSYVFGKKCSSATGSASAAAGGGGNKEDAVMERSEEEKNINDSQRKLKMEICSGSGEWAVAQALNDPLNDWVTLELRHDRAYQTLTRAVFNGVPDNLSMLCGDAMYVLPYHVADESCDEMFVNYPEPAQQTGGEESQGKHLLTDKFFMEVQRVLKVGGRFTILTDNQWYAQFLLRSVATLRRKRKDFGANAASFELTSLDPKSLSAKKTATATPIAPVEEWSVFDEDGGVTLLTGTPGVNAGHVASSSSYFDRLWKRSQITNRFFLVFEKSSGTAGAYGSDVGSSSNLRVAHAKKHITFGDDDEDDDNVTAKPAAMVDEDKPKKKKQKKDKKDK